MKCQFPAGLQPQKFTLWLTDWWWWLTSSHRRIASHHIIEQLSRWCHCVCFFCTLADPPFQDTSHWELFPLPPHFSVHKIFGTCPKYSGVPGILEHCVISLTSATKDKAMVGMLVVDWKCLCIWMMNFKGQLIFQCSCGGCGKMMVFRPHWKSE